VRFTIGGLTQNRLYEFRVQFENDAGKSVFSQPSHRAKTNKALLPGACGVPSIAAKGVDYITLSFPMPSEGGAPIRVFTLEVMDLDDNETRVVKHTRNASDEESVVRVRVPSLKPGGSFIFRVRAESEVGLGPYSEWSPEAKLELVTVDAKDTAAAAVGKARK
jgi:hypothetical protein